MVDGDMERCKAELMDLNDCEMRYDKLLEEKRAALKARGGSYAEELMGIESRIAYLEHRMDEIDEALAAGRRALRCTDDVMHSLTKAGNWSTFDMFSDGIIADIAKHSHLDEAQHKIEALQMELRRFKTELADVGSIHVEMQVNIDGFLRFADYFFDNLFTDWAVMDRISQSKTQVDNTARQIQNVLCRLDSMMAQDQAEWKKLHDESERIITDAKL
jgi:chromosome segregation ATPase